jgi:hypothetical protein
MRFGGGKRRGCRVLPSSIGRPRTVFLMNDRAMLGMCLPGDSDIVESDPAQYRSRHGNATAS